MVSGLPDHYHTGVAFSNSSEVGVFFTLPTLMSEQLATSFLFARAFMPLLGKGAGTQTTRPFSSKHLGRNEVYIKGLLALKNKNKKKRKKVKLSPNVSLQAVFPIDILPKKKKKVKILMLRT